MKNIAYLLRFWPVFGGGETVTRILANELVSRGNNVFVYYLWDRTEGVDAYLDERIICRRVENMSPPCGYESIAKKDYTAMKESLASFLKADKIDVVINQRWPSKLVYDVRNTQGGGGGSRKVSSRKYAGTL